MLDLLDNTVSRPFLRDKTSSEAIGILDELMSNKKNLEKIRVLDGENHWRRMLDVSLQLFYDPPENLVVSDLCNFLHTILVHMPEYSVIQPEKTKDLFKHFGKVLKSTSDVYEARNARSLVLKAVNRLIEMVWAAKTFLCTNAILSPNFRRLGKTSGRRFAN